MTRRRPAIVLVLLALGLLWLAPACGSDSGPGSNPGTTECSTPDTGATDAEASASDTTLVGSRDPEADSGSLGAGGSPGANDEEQQSNSAADGFNTPSGTNPANDEGVTGNADTGSGGSSRGPC